MNFETETVYKYLTNTYEGSRLWPLMFKIADPVERIFGLRNAFVCAWESNHGRFDPLHDLSLNEVQWDELENQLMTSV